MASKGLKITGVVCSIIVVVVLLVILFGDIWLSNTVDKFLRSEFSKINTAYVDFGDLDIRIGQRSVTMKDVSFCTSPDNVLQEDSTGVRLHVDKVSFSGFQFVRMLNRKEIDIHEIALKKPDIELHLPLEGHGMSKDLADTLARDTAQLKSALLRNIIARTVSVSDGHVQVCDVSNQMRVEMEDINLQVHGFGYHFGDTSFTPEDEVLEGHMLYSDSLYSFSLRNFSFLSPDGLSRIDIGELSTKNAGPVNIREIHTYNTCAKGELAERMGKTNVAWTDIRINEITTSPVNLIRQAMARNIEIDSIHIDGEKVHYLRDARYPAKKPFPMPQDEVLAIKIPVLVKQLNMQVPDVQVDVLTTYLENCGTLEFKHMNMSMSNITNREGSKMHGDARMRIGKDGEVFMQFNMTMNRAANFDFSAHVTGLDGSMFNDFSYPIFGAEMQCQIHDVTTSCAGDRNEMKGTYCMQYDSIHVRISKEDSPYQLISKNAGVINLFAPMILPKSNPKRHGDQPLAYDVYAKRDPMSTFEFYLISPILDGSMKTLLPGFVVKHMQKKQGVKALK